ncbi:MAG: HlyD family type I secretion periplasmic adaptor subunit, partial [Halorhodospira sp.]
GSVEGAVTERGPAREGELEPADSGPGSAGPPPTNDRFPRWFGIIVILVAFVGAGGWASLATIDGAVVAPGTVAAAAHRKTIEHLEGGIVQHIPVEDGDVVERGDLLVQLDETQSRAEYLSKWTRYLSLLAQRARLEAEIRGEESLTFPEQVRDSGERRQRTEALMATQREQFQTRREALEGEIAVLRERIEGHKERIEGMQAQRRAEREAIASLEEELATKERLVERDAIPNAELRPIEREFAEHRGQAGQLQASVAEARVQISEAEQQIIQRRREFQSEAATRLEEVSSQVASLEEELQGLRDTLRRKQIRAPTAGEVVNLRVHTRGGVIKGGEPVLDLVPAEGPLILTGRVRPRDVDNVEPGMETDVRFTAFSFRTTPVIQGEVTFLSADRIEPEQDDEQPYYEVKVEVSDEELAKLGDRAELRPGMPADLMINTGERTPLAYLAKPLTDAIARSFRED